MSENAGEDVPLQARALAGLGAIGLSGGHVPGPA
jgi:hypothetical protein